MPTSPRLGCKVVVAPELAFGVYSNAFRVADSDDGRCLLEFLTYSATEHRAKVVARVLVRKAFLPVIRDRIASCLAPSASRLPGDDHGAEDGG